MFVYFISKLCWLWFKSFVVTDKINLLSVVIIYYHYYSVIKFNIWNWGSAGSDVKVVAYYYLITFVNFV
jgi:hypothetical protein